MFGIGMGGEWGVGASLPMEAAPKRLRGILSGLFTERISDWKSSGGSGAKTDSAALGLASVFWSARFPHYWRSTSYQGAGIDGMERKIARRPRGKF